MHLTQKLFLYLTTFVLLTGCSTQVLKPTVEFQNYNGILLKPDSLWELRVVQRNQEKFSGILVLKNSGNMLSIALLDPSGIKLFEENISNNGAVSRIQELSFFENHKLPEYLGQVIHRIFNKVPDAKSCSGGIYNLCWEEEKFNKLKKRAKWGPFSLWNVIYSVGKNAKGNSLNVEHNSPWIGTTFYFSLL